jgi:transcriptional regulator with XRE-family HTH domain
MGRKKIVIPEQELRELYGIRGQSATEVAAMYRCSSQTVINRLRELGLPVRDKREAGLLKKGVRIPCSELRDLYERQGLSSIEIARRYGCSDVVVRKKLAQCGIPIRTSSEAAVQRWDVDISADKLRELYEAQKLSILAIAERYGCTHRTVLNKMLEYGIVSRTISESMALVEGYPKSDFSGDLAEKAYLIGFRLGDLYATMVKDTGHTILVSCTTTRQEQLDLIRRLFRPYGLVSVSEPDRRGVCWIRCYLNMTFGFLLPKEDRIPDWILAEPERYFAPFFAGYVDAEGHFGVSNRMACFKVETCDRVILQQSHAALTTLGIGLPKPRINRPAGHTSSLGVTLRRDLWRLGTASMESLSQVCTLLTPYLGHPKRRRDMERVRANVEERQRRRASKALSPLLVP